MLYWDWTAVERAIYSPPALCSYVNSGQLARVHPGDTLWVASVTPRQSDPSSQLILVGRMRVAFCTEDVAEAAQHLGTSELGDARWHAGIAPDLAEPYTLVSLVAEARRIRFIGGHDTLNVFDGKVRPYALMSLRQVAPDSAARLTMYWQAGRAAATTLERPH